MNQHCFWQSKLNDAPTVLDASVAVRRAASASVAAACRTCRGRGCAGVQTRAVVAVMLSSSLSSSIFVSRCIYALSMQQSVATGAGCCFAFYQLFLRCLHGVIRVDIRFGSLL
mmetsp:Transcript_18674/g.48811  ORF Transcript_18674/g.48811 Transcript_18674/m.48811 type:complete len:113 (-) Transcript_18674:14-352(-)